jgi:chromosome segregation ATPase
MKLRSQDLTGDGFDKNVAEKMPKMRKLEEPVLPAAPEVESEQVEDRPGIAREGVSAGREIGSPRVETTGEERHDVQSLIEDLHTQLLVLNRTKRALEMDLASHQKTIDQMARDNKDLRGQVEKLKKELKQIEEGQYESDYLKEENADALERVRNLQQEMRGLNETLASTLEEKDGALGRIRDLESRLGANEVIKIKGKLKEREAFYYSEENRELQARLEVALTKNTDLEKKYEVLKRSFDEVKESLVLLRDSCKSHYYNLSEPSE